MRPPAGVDVLLLPVILRRRRLLLGAAGAAVALLLLLLGDAPGALLVELAVLVAHLVHAGRGGAAAAGGELDVDAAPAELRVVEFGEAGAHAAVVVELDKGDAAGLGRVVTLREEADRGRLEGRKVRFYVGLGGCEGEVACYGGGWPRSVWCSSRG